ncbi:unnamed protein product [Fusarium venenatum]|uniref:Uncharacterized protein n=1 Tax=Fusarium venenatum TaxID=56646 RepID=A0A2L2SYR5_9HYPO|nr:uncharacterized protein FVRRES_06435 [Fusarium venenatum]CEI61999.1 unnamed protein product [Fusarium venenatum]
MASAWTLDRFSLTNFVMLYSITSIPNLDPNHNTGSMNLFKKPFVIIQEYGAAAYQELVDFR